jgi:arylmalonate decarboxylase
MEKDTAIGIVVPHATDRVPAEAALMYPGVKFLPRGVGVKALTPQGYDSAWEGIIPAAKDLAAQGVAAVMALGTSLTFYRGYAAHAQLLEELRAVTGLPVSTMSAAVVEGLRALGARRIGVCTAYADEVNSRLQAFLTASGFEVLALEGFGLERFNAPSEKSEEDIVALAGRVCAAARRAEALLISCGGLKTLAVGKTIEDAYGVPVVSSTPAALWTAVRLAGHSGRVRGYGRLLETNGAAVG